MANVPVEAKVKAGTAGAGLGAAVGAAIAWFLDAKVYTPDIEGDLPPALSGLVMAAAAAAVAYLAGWLAKHTPR